MLRLSTLKRQSGLYFVVASLLLASQIHWAIIQQDFDDIWLRVALVVLLIIPITYLGVFITSLLRPAKSLSTVLQTASLNTGVFWLGVCLFIGGTIFGVLIPLYLGMCYFAQGGHPGTLYRPIIGKFRKSALLQWVLVIALSGVSAYVVFTSIQFSFELNIPVPYFDEWDLIGAYYKQENDLGSAWLSLHHQHNEHRLIVPRLFFFFDIERFYARGQLNLLVIFVTQGFHAMLLTVLLMRAYKASRALSVAIFASVCMLLFSALQMENLAWGFQLQFTGVYLLATAAIYFFVTSSNPSESNLELKNPFTRLFVAILLAVVATFTMANGMLIWVIALILGLKERWSFGRLSLLLGIAGLVLAFYFNNFAKELVVGDPFSALKDPLTLLHYVSIFIGRPLSPVNETLAVFGGALGLGFAAWLALAFISRTSPDTSGAVEKSLTLVVLFVVGSALLIALGRSHLGVEQALSDRYVTPAIIFWIALVGSLGSHRVPRLISRQRLQLRALLFALAGVVNVAGYQEQWLDRYRPLGTGRQLAVSSLIAGVADSDAWQRVFPFLALDRNPMPKVDRILRRERKSYYSMEWSILPGERLGEEFGWPIVEYCGGRIDEQGTLITADNGGYRLAGWAVDTQTYSAPKVILFADQDQVVVGIGFTGKFRLDVERLYPGVKDSGWLGYARVVPGQTISAYALVNDNRSICRLDGKFTGIDGS